MTRLGLIGLGTWGMRYAETIANRHDCRIVNFAASSATGPRSIPGAVRCQSWHALLELARRGDLDAVIAATTPASQAEIAARAAAQGVPALVEKPLGSSARDASEVLLRFNASESKAPIVVDYIHLFAPAYARLKELVQTSSGGTACVTAIDTQGCNRGPSRGWSPLLDYGPHDVALCLDLLGPHAEFRLLEAKRIPGSPDGELIEAHFELGTASVVMRVGNGARAKARRFAVTLSSGRTLVYDDCQPHPNKLVDRQRVVRVDETLPLDAALTHFFAQRELWACQGPAATEGARWLELSVRVAEILDKIGRML